MGIKSMLIGAGKKAAREYAENARKARAETAKAERLAAARKTAYSSAYKKAHTKELIKSEIRSAKKQAKLDATATVNQSKIKTVKKSEYVTLGSMPKSQYGARMRF